MRKSIPHHIKRRVIERDGCTCVYCGKIGFYKETVRGPQVFEFKKEFFFSHGHSPDRYGVERNIPFDFDHKVPVFNGGNNSLENVVLSCRRCNRSKGTNSIE